MTCPQAQRFNSTYLFEMKKKLSLNQSKEDSVVEIEGRSIRRSKGAKRKANKGVSTSSLTSFRA